MPGKNIILAITGSIAAYKAAVLTRSLIKEGWNVQVLMTEAATHFVSPLTFSTLSRKPVHTRIIDDDAWNNHVELGLWADAMLIAPATATTLAKCARGLADNIIVATYLSARCPVFFAPAMDLDMWKHGSTVHNLEKLQSYGDTIIPVGHGELASGLTGEGRMAEPEDIMAFLSEQLSTDQPMKGKKVMITAGPTHEAIDPVRFIGNRSTGAMGIAIAEVMDKAGAEVHLILGPTNLEPDGDCEVTRVTSAEEMYNASIKQYPHCDIAILAAAVADFTPVEVHERKIKKTEGPARIDLRRTHDIAAELANHKRADQMNIGFALETDSEIANATEKLNRKKFDFIILNSLRDKGAGFGPGTNKVRFIFPDGRSKNFDLKAKSLVARDIVDEIVELLNKK